MRIVSWNCCCGFFGDKIKTIKGEEFNADILVIPECREMDMEETKTDYNSKWYGDHKEATNIFKKVNKAKDRGIGVFWKDCIIMEQLKKWEDDLRHNNDFRYLVPYSVKSVDVKFEPFTLITVWTKDVIKKDKNDRLAYVQKVYAAVDHYKNIGLLNGQVVLIGDFNTFAKSDIDLKQFEKRLEPLTNCAKNTNYWETHTYYDKKGKNNTGIDDFCFVGKDIAEKFKIKLTIPEDKWDEKHRWRGLSDHRPIIVDFDL
jgi:exonuclease III